MEKGVVGEREGKERQRRRVGKKSYDSCVRRRCLMNNECITENSSSMLAYIYMKRRLASRVYPYLQLVIYHLIDLHYFFNHVTTLK